MKTKLARILSGAPVSDAGGKLRLAAVVIFLFLWSLPEFVEFYAAYRLTTFAASLTACLLLSPTLVALRYLDRRKSAPWALVLFAVFSAVFFFGPVAAQNLAVINNRFGSVWAAGFVEEFWKIAPLLAILFFAPRAVGGTRDGLIYGALGGTGFAIFEYTVNHFFDGLPAARWAFIAGGWREAALLGTHNHVIWSAAVGAAIGWAAGCQSGLTRFLVPCAVYAGIALLNVFNVNVGGVLTTMLAEKLFESFVPAGLAGEVWIGKTFNPFPVFAAKFNLLVVNIVLLPILLRVVCRSGDAERRIIREQLDGEIGGAITREEFEGVVADRRCRTRKIEYLPAKVAKKIVQLQNELAAHKAFAAKRRQNPDADPAVRALRERIATERLRAG